MADANILEVIKRLQSRTTQGKIRWQQTANEGVYMVPFRGYSVTLSERPNHGDPDVIDYVFRIFNEDGDLVEEVSDVEFDRGNPNVPTYTLMKGLYTVARRQAMGVDDAIAKLLSELEE